METETEYLIVVEGVKYGRPFRESTRAYGDADAARILDGFRERIANPPVSGLTGHDPTILRAELLTRQVTPWATVETVGQSPIVDAWLASDRHKVHDMDDVAELARGGE